MAQYQLVAKTAQDKKVKSAAYHNMGNALLKEKKLEKAIKAYENALRNNPNDKQTRHNLILAKKMRQQQKDKNKNDKNDKQNKDKNKNDKDNKQNKDKNKKR